MKTLFVKMRDILASGRPVVLVSVVASSGSAPGGPGAHMLVDKSGRQTGTIGGGEVEHRAEMLAVQMLRKGHSARESYSLRHGAAGDIGMVCGGDVEVFFHYIPTGEKATAFTEAAIDTFAQDRDTWLLCNLNAKHDALALYCADGPLATLDDADISAALPPNETAALLSTTSTRRTACGLDLYAEPMVRAGRTIVFGGGHISQALVPLLAQMAFRPVVFEDRPDFTGKDLFPLADDTFLGDFAQIEDTLPLRGSDWIVVLTRGHAADYDVLRQVLRTPHPYVGVIGSRAKTAAVNKKLLADSISQAALDTVHTPIGLAIGAKTPAEIAVSIIAELIQVRADLSAAK